jgi:hypothetical protein
MSLVSWNLAQWPPTALGKRHRTAPQLFIIPPPRFPRLGSFKFVNEIAPAFSIMPTKPGQPHVIRIRNESTTFNPQIRGQSLTGRLVAM